MMPSKLRVLREQTMDLDPEVRYQARGRLNDFARRTHDRCASRRPLPFSAIPRALVAAPALVRCRAARACTIHTDPSLLALIAGRIEADTDPWVRAELVRALAMQATALPEWCRGGAIAALERALADADERVRANAVEELVDLGHVPALEHLRPLMEGTHHRARAAALVAAGRLLDPWILARIWEMVTSDRPSWRTSGEYVVRSLRPFWRAARERRQPGPRL